MSSNQLNSKSNGPVLLLKTIIRHSNRLISSVAMDGENGQRLKLENVRLQDQKVTRSLEVRAPESDWKTTYSKITYSL